MSQTIRTIMLDDLHLSANPESEVEAQNTISFSLDGTDYVIDLDDRHAVNFYDAIRPFRDAARKIPRSPAKREKKPHQQTADLGKIREWAKQNGHAVKDRGRVPADVVAKYEDAHNAF